MKKLRNFVLLGVIGACAVVSLASCSKVSESYATKINDEATDNDDKFYTYEQVKKALGKECVDVTGDVPLTGRTGVLYAIKGVKSSEDLQKKIDKGDKIEGIIVVIGGGNATGASYGVLTEAQIAAVKGAFGA